ncbi:MAG: hypothetical protein KAR06_01445 [Deltaproteobacteria bacterium]|nr:hypothetical protein [Deltaproteobacteria bacterium]
MKKSFKKKVIFGLIVCMCLFLLVFYVFTYKEVRYEFKSKKIELDSITVNIRTMPKIYYSSNMFGRIAVFSSPYMLDVYVGSEKQPLEGTVHISKLKFVNKLTKKVIFEDNTIVDKQIRRYSVTDYLTSNIEYYYKADFEFKWIDLEFEDIVVYLEFSLIQGDKVTEYKTEILLEKDYKAYRAMIRV